MKPTNWDDLRIFLALAREASLSAAARRLEVEHTTVARRVAQLERKLSVKLFDRLARGWTLTSEGRALFDHALALEESVQAFERAAIGQSALAGVVRISMPPLLQNDFVLPHLRALHERYPEMAIELMGERRYVNLARREADIAIRIGKPVESELAVRPLGHIRYCLFGSVRKRYDQLAGQAFIGFDDSLPDLPLKLWLDAFVGDARYVLRTNDLHSMALAAEDGWGIALLPKFVGVARSGLQQIDTQESTPLLPCYLVMHHDVRRSPRVRAAADFLVELFEKHASELV